MLQSTRFRFVVIADSDIIDDPLSDRCRPAQTVRPLELRCSGALPRHSPRATSNSNQL